MQIDGFVGIELLQRLGHLLGRHLLEHLVAHRLVELGQRRGLEVVAKHGDEDAALLRTQQLDQIGEVGLVQRQRQLADFGGVALIDGRLDGMQEIGADRALFVAQFDLACGVLHGLSDRRVLSFPCPDRSPGATHEERKVVRSRGIEPPRAKPTAPSTLRVYQFRHDR